MVQRKAATPKQLTAVPHDAPPGERSMQDYTPDEFRTLGENDVAIVIRMDGQQRLFFRCYGMDEASAGMNMTKLGAVVTEAVIANLSERLGNVVASLQKTP